MFAFRFSLVLLTLGILSPVAFSQVTVNGTLVNNSTIKSTANLTNNSTITATGTLDLDGNLNNSGTLDNTGTVVVGGDWTNSGTYTGDGVVNFLGSDRQSIDMRGGTFSVLSINGGGTKVLATDANVSGTLELIDGVIEITGGNSDLVILQNATITGGSPNSYVDGALFIDLTGLSSVDFPIGKNGVYLPILLDNIDASGEHGFEAIGDKLTSTDDFDRLAPRYWERIEFGGSWNSADVTLPVLGDEEFENFDNVTIVAAPDRSTNVVTIQSSFSGGNTVSSLEHVSQRFISIGEIGFPIVVMNVMTPNGDTQNEYLHIENIDKFSSTEVKVINRWGIEVFSMTGYDNLDVRRRWNGDVDGKFAAPGNYIAIVKADNKTIKQTVSVIR